LLEHTQSTFLDSIELTTMAQRVNKVARVPPPKRAFPDYESISQKETGVSDLTLLSKVSDESINQNLQRRFENGIMYTYIGHVVSRKPFINSVYQF
jgi:myosin-1